MGTLDHLAQTLQIACYIRSPRDIATYMWYTGVDPMTRKPVQVARRLCDRKLQRALMRFFKPENWFTVREAILQAGRQDLIGERFTCLHSA